jgi:hypothetical protein
MKYGSIGSSNWLAKLEEDRPFNLIESETYSTGVVANFWNTTGNTSLWDKNLLIGFTNSDNFEILDEPSFLGTSTVIKAKRPIDIDISVYGPMASGGQGVIIYKNIGSNQLAYQLGSGADYTNANAKTRLNQGEFLILQASALSQREGLLTVWAKPVVNVTLGK